MATSERFQGLFLRYKEELSTTKDRYDSEVCSLVDEVLSDSSLTMSERERLISIRSPLELIKATEDDPEMRESLERVSAYERQKETIDSLEASIREPVEEAYHDALKNLSGYFEAKKTLEEIGEVNEDAILSITEVPVLVYEADSDFWIGIGINDDDSTNQDSLSAKIRDYCLICCDELDLESELCRDGVRIKLGKYDPKLVERLRKIPEKFEEMGVNLSVLDISEHSFDRLIPRSRYIASDAIHEIGSITYPSFWAIVKHLGFKGQKYFSNDDVTKIKEVRDNPTILKQITEGKKTQTKKEKPKEQKKTSKDKFYDSDGNRFFPSRSAWGEVGLFAMDFRDLAEEADIESQYCDVFVGDDRTKSRKLKGYTPEQIQELKKLKGDN